MADNRIKRHFNFDAKRFDSIYDDRKNIFHYLVDNYWRGVVKHRVKVAFRELGSVNNKSILDVGCGSGRYCFELVNLGAKQVVGIDFSVAMIKLANQYRRRLRLERKCQFICATFPYNFNGQKFDISIALGYFDYISNPKYHIIKLKQITKATIIMSFPKKYEWRVPIRKLKFWFKHCPLYLYTKKDVLKLLTASEIKKYDIIDLGRDYLVVAK